MNESINNSLKRPLMKLYLYGTLQKFSSDLARSVPNLDLGFSVFIEQRLRLRGLDAPELGTLQGATFKKFVESRLKDCKFLIIKTHGSDKYDRYLVDVFYLKGEDNEKKILREGIFLNNELLEEKMALAVE